MNLKEKIKKFLKPTKGKIAIFILLFLLLFITEFLFFSCVDYVNNDGNIVGGGCSGIIGHMTGGSLDYFLLAPFILLIPLMFLSLPAIVIVIVNLLSLPVYYYLLACLIATICSFLKKKWKESRIK